MTSSPYEHFNGIWNLISHIFFHTLLSAEEVDPTPLFLSIRFFFMW